jgi:hypothetical protein
LSHSLTINLTIGEVVYTASPSMSGSDKWLDGALVQEWREIVAPSDHAFLRVYFDSRVYTDDSTRFDVTVENVLNIEGATSVVYDLDVLVDDVSVFSKSALTHYWLTRWRKVFYSSGFTPSTITPDFTLSNQAKATIPYLDLVPDTVYDSSGASFEILGQGALHNPMNDVGARPEIAPYPGWAANYLAKRNPLQLDFVLLANDRAGSWPVHIRESDGTLVSIDTRPNFWLDSRAETDGLPLGDLSACGTLYPDIAHQPSLGYIPYLITGDRYYCDEMAFWANLCLIGTWQSTGYDTRRGAQGLLKPNETRGIGWALRNLGDAAAYLPDNQTTLKAYFADKIDNNLVYLDTVAETPGPLGVAWLSIRADIYPYIRAALWEHTFVAWAIGRCNDQGFSGGTTYKNQIVTFQNTLFNSGETYQREFAAPYELWIGNQTPDLVYYETLGDVFTNTYSPTYTPTQFAGFYGSNARLMLLDAIKLGLSGAQSAYDYLYPFIAVDVLNNGLSDLEISPGWALNPLSDSTESSHILSFRVQ